MSDNDESKPLKAPKTPNLEKPLDIARPWSHASLVERYGPEGGEAAYCAIATAGGYFNPKTEMGHRPDLA